MNSSVFLCIALMFVGVAYANIAAEAAANSKACAADNNISTEELTNLRTTVDKHSIDASDDLKCFTKCVIDKNAFLKDGNINIDRLVEVSVAVGRKESTVRANLEKCKSLYNGSNDCNQSWELYACFQQQ